MATPVGQSCFCNLIKTMINEEPKAGAVSSVEVVGGTPILGAPSGRTPRELGTIYRAQTRPPRTILFGHSVQVTVIVVDDVVLCVLRLFSVSRLQSHLTQPVFSLAACYDQTSI